MQINKPAPEPPHRPEKEGLYGSIVTISSKEKERFNTGAKGMGTVFLPVALNVPLRLVVLNKAAIT